MSTLEQPGQPGQPGLEQPELEAAAGAGEPLQQDPEQQDQPDQLDERVGRARERRTWPFVWIWRQLYRLGLAHRLRLEKRRGFDRRARVATKPWGK